MLVSKIAKLCVTPDAKPKMFVTPDAKPKRKSVEYRLLWVPNSNVSHWPCTIHVFFLYKFHLRWVPNANAFSVEYGLNIGNVSTSSHNEGANLPTNYHYDVS